MEYRAIAVPTQALEDSDLEVGRIYLFDAPNCPDEYCGEWVCIDGASDNLCRDTVANPDDCGDCEEYDGSLAEPYELEPNPTQSFWNKFTETETNDCCDIICPTICDDFGTPVDCIGGTDGCGIDSCFNSSLIQYQLDVGVNTSNASADSNAGPTCGITTYTTSADTEFIGSWSGTTNSRPNCPDDVLMIGLIYKVNFTTSPWRCDEFLDTVGNCGGWCTSTEGNAPPNDQYSYARFVITVGPCGSYTAINYGNVPPQYANEAIPGYVAAIAALETWDDVTNGCGFGLNPTVPDRNAGAITNTLNSSSYIGWGGDGICLDWESQRPFRPMLDCSGGQTVAGSTVMGEVDWSIRVRLSLPNRPDPC